MCILLVAAALHGWLGALRGLRSRRRDRLLVVLGDLFDQTVQLQLERLEIDVLRASLLRVVLLEPEEIAIQVLSLPFLSIRVSFLRRPA